MNIRNSEQLGRAIRIKRKERGLSQITLAARIGVGRKWIMGVEAGNPKAELGLTLKLLKILGIRALLSEKSGPPSQLDEVFDRLQRRESQ